MRCKEFFNTANILSIIRVPLAVLVVLFFGNKLLVFIFIVLAIISDGLDGYVARKQGSTRFGAFLDPLCDKIFVGVILIFFLLANKISVLSLTVLLSRELFLIFLVIVFLDNKDRYTLKQRIKARIPGKILTVVQFLFILSILFYPSLSFLLLCFAIAITVIVIIDYSQVVFERTLEW